MVIEGMLQSVDMIYFDPHKVKMSEVEKIIRHELIHYCTWGRIPGILANLTVAFSMGSITFFS